MKNFKFSLLVLGLSVIWLAIPAARAANGNVAFTTLAALNDTNNGADPYDPPTLGADGNLYLVTPGGGTNGIGVVLKVGTDGSQTVLHVFDNGDGANPVAPLVSGQDGNLYGVASAGGTNNLGTIFEITTNGAFTLLYSFGMITNSSGYALDGSTPYGGMVQGRDGNFYGITYSGGISNYGTVFQFSTGGTLTTLYSFTGTNNAHGAYPYTAPLVEGADGVFYGTTSAGGTNNDGTVFQITSTGILTTLFEFNYTNGLNPYAGLSFGPDGNLYGTTVYGGASDFGTGFRITTNGILTTLFQGGTNNYIGYPEGGLIPGTNGILYGTAYEGGTIDGYGAVFQVTTNGALTTLYTFTNGSDGANPYAGVIRDAGGNLYGTALYGGNQGGYGTIYRLSFHPALLITDQLSSNIVFTATGTATDYLGVTNVFYSLNGSNWTNAITTNGWTNWTATVSPLLVGTNTLSAYAVNVQGNSTTNTATVDYVVNMPLTLSETGRGTISPNYSNALLAVNQNYTMTATTATGFAFTNWTSGDQVLTNGATLQFTMESNLVLTANFSDIAPPTLSITNPTVSGAAVSNANYVFSGVAGDNVAVATVFYSLNGAAWSNATSGNGWTNWAAPVTLNPGTNTFSAYAVDTSGNLSTTNTTRVDYVVTVPLTLSITGRGTISPNYSNALLVVYQNYAMTATAASGFAFTNWTSGDQVLTNGATLKFVMESNLVLTANFLDVTKPTLSITNPTVSGVIVSNANYVFSGIAGDNVAVATVFYSFNDAAWTPATSGNNWTNWTAPVTLNPGTNTLSVYAVDTSGNLSITNTTRVDYIVSTVLTLGETGRGTISPNYSNAVLAVNQNYTMTATAATGFVFTNWTSGVQTLTNGATLQFTMESNLVLTANFLDVTKPTLSITNPTVSGVIVSNANYVFSGIAGDNVAVATVFYSFNGMPWTNAISGNGWTNWMAPATLNPGTNTLSVYAVDTSGNLSITNTTRVDYIVSAVLTLSETGRGTISPNYSNAVLAVNQNYTMTATAATGFVFTNWTSGVQTLTNGATLQFTMASNLVLTANFIETTKPVITIVTPTAGQHMTNAIAYITGTASDNWKVNGVWYQLNNGVWNPVGTTNGFTNWNATATLLAGTNTIDAYALNLGGNYSATNNVSIVSSNTFKLQLAFTAAQPLGAGGLNFSLQISPGLNGQVQASTNLSTWTTLTNFVGTNATINFNDPAATNYNQQFFRAVIP